jgi:hypothetical protein
MEQQTFDIFTAAQAYVAAGLSVIPVARGTKEPEHELLPRVYDETTDKTRPSWRPYQDRPPNEAELRRWFAHTEASVGIVCGAVSGGLVVLDIESPELYKRWRTLAAALIDAPTLDNLPIVASGKGRHIYLRMEAPVSNRKLAVRGREVLAETRGQGGYVVAPPSPHPNSKLYELLSGDLCCIPLLDLGTAEVLLDAARALAQSEEYPTQVAATGAGESVIEAYNRRYGIAELLEAHGYRQERPGRYIRPDGERGSVIIVNDKSIHYNPADPLYSEAPGGGYHAHTPFSAFCTLAHDGNVRAAVRAAAQELGMDKHIPSSEQLAEAGRSLALGQDTTDSWPYFVLEGGLWMHQQHSDGSPKTPLLLCNFVARIAAETVLDDGGHQEELYTVEAICQGRKRSVELRRTEFESEAAVARIVAALGARARVNPRAQPRFLLDAIKALSAAVREEIIHTHTGWVGGRFLVANGYVDAAGWHEAPGCQLPRRLQQYRLIPPAAPLTEALAVFDSLLGLAPTSVMVPLLGGVLLAPILDSIEAPAPMVHLYGPTGSHKTSVTCAALALFGDFTPSQPSDTWTSTANSIQRLGWHLKDMPMLLDDYKAANVKPQQVTFLLQNYGDNMARGRLDANSEVRSAFPIRGTLLSSGEDQPEGEASTLARILSVQLGRRSVHRGRLSEVQQRARLLQLLTVDYLCWLAAGEQLAGNHELHQATRTSFLARLEDALDNATNPGRIASNVAALYVAWECFGRFLAVRGHWPEDRVQAWLLGCKRDLLNLARTQLDMTTHERYSQLFLETVRGLIASGRAILADLAAAVPELRPGQVLLGGRDAEGTYLIVETAYDEVCKQLRAAGRPVTFSQRALSQLFEQDGLLLDTSPPHLTVKKRINGIRPRCWHLPAGVLDG